MLGGDRRRARSRSSPIGVLLGTLLPSARAAQAIGLLLFFPSFLLGVGGPPPEAMSETLRNISEVLPLALVNQAIREPWLGLGSATGSLIAVPWWRSSPRPWPRDVPPSET